MFSSTPTTPPTTQPDSLASAPAAAAAATPAAPSPAGAGPTRSTGGGHPLIWAALLVWIAVEAIGDGLLALRSVLATGTGTRRVTPS